MATLQIRQCGADRQFEINNDHVRPADFDNEYVMVSGFFGALGPQLLAAAPELKAALERAEKHVETLHSLMLVNGSGSKAVKILWRDIEEIRAALKLAGGA